MYKTHKYSAIAELVSEPTAAIYQTLWIRIKQRVRFSLVTTPTRAAVVRLLANHIIKQFFNYLSPMYVPKTFEAPSIEHVRSFVEDNGFATLVSAASGDIMATHTPLMIETIHDEEFLTGHIARGNQQHHAFGNDRPLLAIFIEHHSYISSSWYDHINVPTWNYIAVHIKGTTTIMDGEELKQSLKNLVSKYEPKDGSGFSVDDMPKEMLSREMKGIVGFRMRIDSIEASYKLSQNRHDADYQNIISKLRARGDDFSLKIASDMAELRQHDSSEL